MYNTWGEDDQKGGAGDGDGDTLLMTVVATDDASLREATATLLAKPRGDPGIQG